jgi:hypothetical protein
MASSSMSIFAGPLAGIRLNSTTNGGTLTLTAIQNAGG